jgi:PadR family transcriptional regulator PadR
LWLNKFLDLKDDIDMMKSELKKHINKDKLTPLEFTILETIFNNKAVSGYELIQNLNRIFSDTWKATSGTIYPILSKLKKDGFLKSKQMKSPIGPLKKLYTLTEAGEIILKTKVNKNYLDEIRFIQNIIIELSTVYIHSFPEVERDEKVNSVQNLIKNSFETLIKSIPANVAFKILCPECGTEIDRSSALYCPYCGLNLYPEEREHN